MKRVRLHLTGIAEVITEAAEKKLEKADNYQIPVCSNGKNANFYDDIGIPLPLDLVEKLKNQDKGIELNSEDFEEAYSDISIFDDDILFKVTDLEGTVLFVKGGYTLTVLETVDEIDSYIDYMSRNWLEKIRDYVLFFFCRKNKEQ
jgi:hypothetical protein